MISSLFTHFSAVSCNTTFFGMKPWHYYLTKDPATCELKNFKFLPADGKSDILLIGLAVLDDLLIVAGLVAIGYVIYGGILYVTSQGSPDQTSKAMNTIQNSLIGLVIALLAIATVQFLGSRIG